MYIRCFLSTTRVFLGDLFPVKMLDVPKQLIPGVTSWPGIEEVPGTQDYQFLNQANRDELGHSTTPESALHPAPPKVSFSLNALP